MSYGLWAVLDTPTGKAMMKLRSFEHNEDALAAWKLADDRRLAGVDRLTNPANDEAIVVRYLAVRDDADAEWARKHPNINVAILSILLTRVGGQATVRIYGSIYTGRVVKAAKKSADVEFYVSGELRTRHFPISLDIAFERGVLKAW